MQLISNFLFIFLIFVFGYDCAQKPLNLKCNQKSLQKIDNQMATVFPVLSGGKMPETEKQLQKYCPSVSSAIESATSYIKSCGGTFGPIIAKVISSEHKKELNSICKFRNEKKVRDVLSAGKCGNSISNKIQKCMNIMIDSITALKGVPFENKVNTGCCHAYKIVSCMQRAVSKSKRCDREMVDSIEKIVLEELGDFCGIYFSNNEKCNQLITNAPKLNDTYVRPKSLFSPMMGLMDSFRNMKCTPQTEQKMDSFLEEILTIGTPDLIPETSNQMNKWCTKAKHYAPYMYGYIESCVSDFGKMLAKMMAGMASYSYIAQPICSKRILDNPNPYMREYIKAAKCGNRAEDKIKVCFDGFNENMLGISEAPETSRIKMACCNGYNFRTCVFNATTTTRGCSQQTIEWTESQIMSTVEPAINMICPDIWGNTKKCERLLSDIPKMDPKTFVRPKSPFFPIIKMLDSFPDVDLDEN